MQIIFSLVLLFIISVNSIPCLAQTSNDIINNTELGWYYTFDKNTQNLTAPKEASFLSSDLALYKGNENEKILYLTFDEGYENGFTNQIVNILNDNNVPAAFFVTKSYIEKEPEIIKNMHNSGHLVCNHSSKHKSMPTLIGKTDFEKEFTDTNQEFKKITGENMPIFFRPPMGKYSHASLLETKKLGYVSVFWSFAYKDWLVNEQPSEDAAFKKITENIHNGQILLLHACSKTNANILDKLIKHLKSEGYEFKSLHDIH